MDLVQCVKAAGMIYQSLACISLLSDVCSADSLIEFFQRLETWMESFAAAHTLSEKRELPGPPLAGSLAKEV